MYTYKMTLKNGTTYIVRSKKSIKDFLHETHQCDWMDFLLLKPNVTYLGDKRVVTNIAMINTKELVSVEYLIDNPKLV